MIRAIFDAIKATFRPVSKKDATLQSLHDEAVAKAIQAKI